MAHQIALKLIDAGSDWGAIFLEHAPWLRTVIRCRLGEEQAVEDVLQNVAVASVQSKHRPEEIRQIAPWLYRVAVKQTLRYRRTAGRARKRLDQLQSMGNNSPSPPSALDPLRWLLLQERERAVHSALDDLDEVDRQLLWLKYTEHWTYQQLADRLGVTVHTIEHRLLTARRRLRARLAQLAEGGER